MSNTQYPDSFPDSPAAPTAQTGAVPWTQRPVWVLMALAVWLWWTAGWRPLLLPDEGRYSEVAREMLRATEGPAGVPWLNGVPFFHKPPLMYALDMLAMTVLGVNEWAARVAPLCGAWLMGAGLYTDLRRRLGAVVAWRALVVVATCPFLFYGGQFANHDMLVAGWITVAVLCGQWAVQDPARVDRRWVLAAWAAMALGVLSKGLIGVVLPSLVVGGWCLMHGRWRQCLGLLHPGGVALFGVVAAPWFWRMEQVYPGFLEYFFVDQHFRRYAQGGFNNVQPFYFYLVIMPVLTLPWIVFLPRVVAAWRRATDASSASGAPGFSFGFYAWWCAAIWGFFSLPQSKPAGYILPALAPLGGVLGVVVAQGAVSTWRRVSVVGALLCVAIIAGLWWRAPNSMREVGLYLRANLQPGDRVAYVDDAFFDVSFYADLAKPAVILADWDNPEHAKADNWHKELLHGARFDPARGQQVLVNGRDVARLQCGPGSVWLVSRPGWKPEGGSSANTSTGTSTGTAPAAADAGMDPDRPGGIPVSGRPWRGAKAVLTGPNGVLWQWQAAAPVPCPSP